MSFIGPPKASTTRLISLPFLAFLAWTAGIAPPLPSLRFQLLQWMSISTCRVHKPGVPRGPAPTPGLGPEKQHVVHGPAQESKNTTGRKDIPVPDRKVYPKEKTPARQLLWPTSPTGALASGTSRLRAVSPIERPGPKHCLLLRPGVSDRGPVGSLLAALLQLAR